MNYRYFGKTGCLVSALGFGAMRLPLKEIDGKTVIDRPTAVDMIRHGIKNGVNYIDTANVYHDNESEGLVGEALSGGWRERTYIATKCPTWMVNSEEDFDRYLDTQLSRLGTDYIDFYLLHTLDRNLFKNVVLKYKLIEKCVKAKEAGKIRHIGFSFHDDFDTFKETIDYTDVWEFCQIQFNYINTDYQAGVKGLKYAAEKGLGVIVMEPLLGGRLAAPPAEVAKVLPENKTAVEWALDYIWNYEGVSMLLSGMSNPQQVRENISYASSAYPGMLTKDELEMFANAKDVFDNMPLVGCTKCAYCMPCPFGINIPGIFDAYNKSISLGKDKAKEIYSAFETKADACRKCGRCETLCPQHIRISSVLAEIAGNFD